MSKTQRLLIVDDTPQNVRILNDLLGAGHAVSAAANGVDALELAKTERPDLILLDIMMPEMDGYEICRRLKADDATRAIPVIFITVKSDIEDEQKGFELGAVDYITKPFSPPIVKARVKNHLLLKAQHDQLKQSISILQHEAGILGQKAEIGIQAGGFAHDMANILSAAKLVGYIPRSMPKNLPEWREILDDLDSAAKSIALGIEICRGYTCYLRNIGEPAQLQSPVDLLQPLDMYARKFKGQLVREVAEAMPPVFCVGYQIKRVMVNLFMNAMQAVDGQDEQVITLRVYGDRDKVLFSCQDNGPGIPAAILPRIFEENFTTKTAGTGLGLFLAKQIADVHGGAIEVRSLPGEGAAFTLALPANRE